MLLGCLIFVMVVTGGYKNGASPHPPSSGALLSPRRNANRYGTFLGSNGTDLATNTSDEGGYAFSDASWVHRFSNACGVVLLDLYLPLQQQQSRRRRGSSEDSIQLYSQQEEEDASQPAAPLRRSGALGGGQVRGGSMKSA